MNNKKSKGMGTFIGLNKEQTQQMILISKQLKANKEDIISNILLDFAGLYNDVDTSDLQSIAVVKAREIIKLLED